MNHKPSPPSLIPPCPGWQADLPKFCDPPQKASLTHKQRCNHRDDIYLEIPRGTLITRGFLLPISILATILYATSIDVITHSWLARDWAVLIGGTLAILSGLWLTTSCARYDISPPQDEPIRFNRLRQRIYAYNFKPRWWNPFMRWPVEVVVYDWSQVQAERWMRRIATTQGGSLVKWGIVLSIVEPGTNKVIDRFALNYSAADDSLWEYICIYMQEGPSTLPLVVLTKDDNNTPWYNISKRLAPKVNWPTDLDVESRTAP